ncbi:MFS transporter [Amycolatopsis deserti]|uniref:MFS transporter n=1 Tax=Amycolatopsis deserti TaxID=185696 RepID=A0ABQ3JEU8_9PSEU|nr:MFS transporter [Amycolatopsis deserti]GHF18730.1 MFS transporter [Amycolatopsis deserti]
MPDPHRISTRLDTLPVTRFHRYVVAVVGIATFFDLFDLFLASSVSAVLQQEFGVAGTELKLVLASAFIGAFAGALAIGRLADRVGRRNAFLLTLALYSFFSMASAFSTDVWMLVVCRFLAGIGLGAELPLADAYLADVLPPSARGRMTAWAYTLGFCGVPASGFLARALLGEAPLGLAGWRWLFLIGALGAAIVWILRTNLPESPRWLAATGRHDQAERVVRRFEKAAGRRAAPAAQSEPDSAPGEILPARALLRPPWRRRTLMLYLFQLLQTFGYYGFGSLVPMVLAAKGFSLSHSLTFSAVSFLGYPLGSALSIPVIERLQRKWLIVASAVGMAVFGLAFGYASTGAAIAVFGFCYTAVSNVFSNAFHTYQGELFPTSVRAGAAGSAYALSRLATAAMPFILIPVLDSFGPTALFTVVASAMALLVVDVAVLGPRTTGLSVDEISSPRHDGASRARAPY